MLAAIPLDVEKELIDMLSAEIDKAIIKDLYDMDDIPLPLYIDTTRLAELTKLERKLCQKYIDVLLRKNVDEDDQSYQLAHRNLVALHVLVTEDVYTLRRKLKALVEPEATQK